MPRNDGTPHPSQNPSLPQEGRVFYRGAWRTPEQIEAFRVHNRKYMRKYYEENKTRLHEYDRERAPRRIRMSAGGVEFFIGYAPTVEVAAYLRAKIKEEVPK